jgi:hypothetical protein
MRESGKYRRGFEKKIGDEARRESPKLLVPILLRKRKVAQGTFGSVEYLGNIAD